MERERLRGSKMASQGKNRYLFLWRLLAALLSGLMLACCYAPVRWGGLAWLALMPLVAAVWFWGDRGWLRALGLGYVAGLLFYLVTLFWIVEVTVPGWVIVAFYLAIYPALWCVCLDVLARRTGGDWFGSWRNLGAGLLMASAWVCIEWIRGHFLLGGFPWNALGVAVGDNLPMVQIADTTGVAGVSFLVALVNVIGAVTLYRVFFELRRGRMRAHFDFSLTVVLVAGVFGYGIWRLGKNPERVIEVTFAAVQPATPIAMVSRTRAQDQAILDKLSALSMNALALKPDLLVWPEATPPRPLFLDKPSLDTVGKILDAGEGDFLSGIVHYTEVGDFNSAVLFTGGDIEAPQLYHKMHLVPFGEYLPLRESVPLIKWITGELIPDDFDAGNIPVILDMEKKPVRLGVLICFEDSLGWVAREMARGGAQMFVNLTNDAWFNRSAASAQQRDNAIFRAIEARRPILRVANTGVTCLIDECGREISRLVAGGDTFGEGFLAGTVRVPETPEDTFFVRFGNIFSYLCMLLTVLFGGMSIYTDKKR